MIKEIIEDAEKRMEKSLNSLEVAFAKIRTGRAHPSLLDGIIISYFGTDTPINQIANISVEEARSLIISPWEKQLIPEIEKAILKSDLGLNPSSSSDSIRLPMPPPTKKTGGTLLELLNLKLKMRGSQSAIFDGCKWRFAPSEKKKSQRTSCAARRGYSKLTDAKA